MTDKVNHPSHYCREGSMECIEEMLLLFGKEEVKSFCKLNAWKYRYRAADKNGAEDLAKSDWYLRKYKELCDKEQLPSITVISPSDKDAKITPYLINKCYTTSLDNDD